MYKHYYNFNALGTRVNLTIFDKNATLPFDMTVRLVEYYEELFSIYRPSSEISQINQNAGIKPFSVSDSSLDLIKLAKNISLKHTGFNIAIGPLVKEWNIGFQNAHVPSQSKIKELLHVIDPNQIEINERKKQVYLTHPNMQLDLGAIAKGYIADRIKDLWKSLGIKNGIIDLGGNLLIIGNNPLHHDQLWKIGIQDPWHQRGNPIKIVKTPACSVVTSGIYERYFKSNDHFYHHIIDPRTGYPLKTNVVAVSAFTTNSTFGEIASSELFFNPDHALEDPEFLGAIIIFDDHSCKMIKNPNMI